MTYIDDNGSSVYGQRIRNLGESKCNDLDARHTQR